MLKTIIMNRKWQKIVFIICAMLYTAYALLAFTMFKKMDWYKELRDFGNHYFYYFFAVLAFIMIIRKFIEFFEESEDHYNIVEAILVFIDQHVILAIIGVCFYIDYLMMIQNGSHTKYLDLPFFFFYMLCASDYEFEDYLPMIFGASLGVMAVTVACNLYGILPDILYQRSAAVIGHSFGYIWPLSLHAHFFILILLYITLRKDKFNIIEFLITSALNVFLTVLTTAKTGAILTELALVGALLLHYEKPKELVKKWIGLFYAWFVAAPVISYAVALLYRPQSPFWISVNAKLNNRPLMQYRALKKHGIDLFGRKMHWKSFGSNHKVTEAKYNFVDNSFMKYSLDYGLLMLILFIPGFIYAAYRFFKKNNYSAIWCLAVVFMFGLFQHQALLITMNPLILSFSSLFMVSVNDIKEQLTGHEEI